MYRRHMAHAFAQKIKKSPGQKNSWNFTLTKIHFLPFQTWPKINFWTGKKFKTAKNAISRKKKFWFSIWFHEFFGLDFFKFSGLLWEIQEQGEVLEKCQHAIWTKSLQILDLPKKIHRVFKFSDFFLKRKNQGHMNQNWQDLW